MCCVKCLMYDLPECIKLRHIFCQAQALAKHKTMFCQAQALPSLDGTLGSEPKLTSSQILHFPSNSNRASIQLFV